MVLALSGLSMGVAGTLALVRLGEAELLAINAGDPVPFLGVLLLLTVVALLACYLPARRATKVDPMVALRYE